MCTSTGLLQTEVTFKKKGNYITFRFLLLMLALVGSKYKAASSNGPNVSYSMYRFLSLQATLALRHIARRRPPVVWAHPRSRHWWDTIVPDFTAEQLVQNFRVSRESFEYICGRVRSDMGRRNTNYRMCVTIQKQVAIAIRKLATGSEYRTISHLFGVGLSTVFNCVQDFCYAVNRVLLPVHIIFPDAYKFVELDTFFENRWRVPQCVGAIDESHIPIIAPEEYPRDYYIRKRWHSIVLQAG